MSRGVKRRAAAVTSAIGGLSIPGVRFHGLGCALEKNNDFNELDSIIGGAEGTVPILKNQALSTPKPAQSPHCHS